MHFGTMVYLSMPFCKCYFMVAWLMWLCGLSTSLQTERLLGGFPVRARAWVAGQIPS